MSIRKAWYFTSLGLLACGGGGDPGTTTMPPAPPPPPTATTAVDVIDNAFDPMSISPARAATVTWTWKGAAQHNVTFEDGQGSSTTQVSGAHQRAFAAAGTFRYRCTIHSSNFTSGMVGAVVVP